MSSLTIQLIAVAIELLFAAGLWQFLMSLTKHEYQRPPEVPDLLPIDTITTDSDYRGLVL